MPEGPEVETIRSSLAPRLVGATILSASTSGLKLRSEVPPELWSSLSHRTVRGVFRHGKLMWLSFDEHSGMMVRLGMSGKLLLSSRTAELAKHTHVRLPLNRAVDSKEDIELRYVDPRRFGSVEPFVEAQTLANARSTLGPDLIEDLSREEERGIVAKVRSSSRPIKDILLDQRVFAGVGNIYAAEALFAARVSPFSQGNSLSVARAAKLVHAASEVMRKSVGLGGTSFSDYVDGLGNPGQNIQNLFVFDREGESCRVCRTTLVRAVQSGRSTVYCAKCQKVR